MEKQKLQTLRSQVNPHFLFNTLNVLMYRAKEEHATSTAQMLRSLSTLYRYATTNDTPQVPLSRELQIVTSYASLCEARFGDRMRFTLILPKEIDVTEVMTPPFILQPLVENAFKHGLTPKEGRGTVQVAWVRTTTCCTFPYRTTASVWIVPVWTHSDKTCTMRRRKASTSVLPMSRRGSVCNAHKASSTFPPHPGKA
ncbi:MAG: histidine kinase [Sphaerochaeta sp.]|nr:histidine kinase [Sphaerochaeta sp.]